MVTNFSVPRLRNFAIFTVQLRAMLSVNNVSMRYGARVLFEDVTCTFMAGRRYAISGPNGAGKSTFMKILTGEIEPTNGNVSRPKRMGVLRQDQFAFDDFRVIDTVIMGNSVLWADRKSTRLNSSHSQISYAVFCLKKKKK